MTRMLMVCALVLFNPWLSWARSDSPPEETVRKLTLTPRAVPLPALRYQLLPELSEMNPGNPVLNYLKCFMEQNHFFHNKAALDERERYLTLPMEELRKVVKETSNILPYGGSALRQADYAARLDTADWQVLPRLRKEGIGLVISEVQQVRSLATALKARTRLQIAAGQPEEALAGVKSQMAMARHMMDHPTLLSGLVGTSIAMHTTSVLEDFIEDPQSPNLSWALASLPSPFIDLRKGFQGEMFFLEEELSIIHARAAFTEAETREVVARVQRFVDLLGPGAKTSPKNVETWLQNQVADSAKVQAARARLAAANYTVDKLAALSPTQIILLDEKRTYQIQRDDILKYMNFSYDQIPVFSPAKPETLFSATIPPLSIIQRARVRLDQRLALLRVIEALRHYAATHEGGFPAQLADLDLPLPVDPVTGKTFRYAVKGTTAYLQGTPPRGEEQNPQYRIRYEVSLRK